MLKNICKLIGMLALAGFNASAAQSSLDFTGPVLIEGSLDASNVFPIREKGYSDGIVDLVFMVNPDGVPDQIDVVRSSGARFEKAAIKHLRTLRYQSAVYTGKNIESRQTARIRFKGPEFSFGNQRTFRPYRFLYSEQYVMLFNKALKELGRSTPREKKLRATLERMQRLKLKFFFHRYHTGFIKYQHSKDFLGKLEEHHALQDMMMYADEVRVRKISKLKDYEPYFDIELLRLMLDLGHYQEAQIQYWALQESNPEVANTFTSMMAKVEEIKSGETVVESGVYLAPSGKGFLTLFKRKFSVETVGNNLESAELRCERKYQNLGNNFDVAYELPSSWGICELQVTGKPGVSVTVLQQ